MSTDPTSLNGVRKAAPSEPRGPERAQNDRAQVDGAAFRALLERMEESARALARTSEGVDDPRQLRPAVESARAALDEALSVGGDLLEAYRASQLRGADAAEGSESTPNTKTQPGSGGSR